MSAAFDGPRHRHLGGHFAGTFRFLPDSSGSFSREVLRGGILVNVAAKELQLLRQLIDYRGQILSRDRLLARVWHDRLFIGPRTDVHVAWLRQKLEENPQAPRYIVTVRGEGYGFEP